MRAHPSQLRRILKDTNWLALDDVIGADRAGKEPLLNSFVHICEALEPEVSLDEADSLTWWNALDELKIAQRTLRSNTLGRFRTQPLHELAKLAENGWRGPTRGPYRQLTFISNPGLRFIAERDLVSLANARKSEDTKVALVMAGCVVEAALLDLVLRTPGKAENEMATVKAKRVGANSRVWAKVDSKDPESWSFAHLVAVAGQDGLKVLDERTEEMADRVRDWRNFVHPWKETEETLKAQLRPEEAAVAESVALLVLATLTPP